MHLVGYLESNGFGGAEAVMRGVLAAAARDHRVTVVCPFADVAHQVAALDERIEVVVCPEISHKRDLRAAYGLRRVLAGIEPDVIHINLPDMAANLAAIGVASTLPGVGIVLVEHSAHAPQSMLQFVAKRISARRADEHVAVSASLSGLVAAASAVPVERITVIPNGAELIEPYTRTPGRAGVLRVGVVTRLTREKGVDVLIDAVHEMDAVEVQVAGDGPARAELQAQIDVLGLTDRVHLVGWLDAPDSLYRSVDVVVHPSRADVMPMSILEAMHHALPVVASEVGGIPLLVEPGVTGVLFPLDDVAACRAAIESLRDPATRERLGETARGRAIERYSADAQHAAYLAAYERAYAAALRRRGRLRRTPLVR